MKWEANNLKEPPPIELFLKGGLQKPSFAVVTQRSVAGSFLTGTKAMNSSKSGTSVFFGGDWRRFPWFWNLKQILYQSKFLKAGSSHNRTPDSLFRGSEPSKVTVASGPRTSYTWYNSFSTCFLV